MRRYKIFGVAVLFMAITPANAAYNVLWWDSTPTYGGQAPDSYRQEMADSLTAYNGGSTFNATYVSSETAGTLATYLSSHTFDVIVFDATSADPKFNADDISAARDFYSSGRKNILLDGTLYIRNIDYNSETNYPGPNSSMLGLNINEIYSLASRGGGFMIGTDHNCCQVDANQILNGLMPSASFSGYTVPSTDGQFNGTEMLDAKVDIAAADVLAQWSAVPSEAVTPTGTFTDFLGNSVTLYSQVDVADQPGGGPRYSYISTSFAASGGGVIITDPNPGGGTGAVPEPSSWALLITGFGAMGTALRRARRLRAASA